MRVFGALLLDSYRELNSKKLFWVILAISLVVVLVYGSIGFDEAGMTMWYGLSHIESDFITSDSPFTAILYRSIFSTFIVGVWLAIIATILALVSTTTIFPDFVSSGAIDLVLSKPIGRVRLFAAKYLASLLFVLLQVTVICVGALLCIGLRLGDWEWKILAAIPIVLAFYSYLYAINVLVGVWTRSALAALLVTIMLWFGLYCLNQTEGVLNLFCTTALVQAERAEARIADAESRLDALKEDETSARAQIEFDMQRDRKTVEDNRLATDRLEPWQRLTRSVQTFLPKTGETIGLLERLLKRDDEVNLLDIMRGDMAFDASGDPTTTNTGVDREVEGRLLEEYEQRSLWYVIGTSLLFELGVLGLACFIFARRDY